MFCRESGARVVSMKGVVGKFSVKKWFVPRERVGKNGGSMIVRGDRIPYLKYFSTVSHAVTPVPTLRKSLVRHRFDGITPDSCAQYTTSHLYSNMSLWFSVLRLRNRAVPLLRFTFPRPTRNSRTLRHYSDVAVPLPMTKVEKIVLDSIKVCLEFTSIRVSSLQENTGNRSNTLRNIHAIMSFTPDGWILHEPFKSCIWLAW